MTSRVSRADLLNYLSHAEWDDLSEVVDCFGYKQPLEKSANKQPLPPEQQQPAVKLTTSPPPKPAPTADLALPSEVFYRLSDTQPSELLSGADDENDVPMPDWVKNIDGKALDLNAPKYLGATPPPLLPLQAWAQLWPWLRHSLSHTQHRPQPDVKKLVKQIASGQQLTRIPQQRRRTWAAKVVLLIDDAERLQGLNQDCQRLKHDLVKLRGTTGLETVWLTDGPDTTWLSQPLGTPLLLLSDLGIYEPTGKVTQRWIDLGRRLKQQGHEIHVLIPASLSAVPQALTHDFQCVCWDRFNQAKQSPTADTDTLLALLSVAEDIEPRLIRALRYQLPYAEPLGVATELQVWNHEHVERCSTHLSIKSGWRTHYQTLLGELLVKQPALAKPLYQHIKQQLVGELLVDYYNAVTTTASLTGVNDAAFIDDAEKYLQQFILATHQLTDHKGLLYHGYYWLEHQSDGVKADKEYLSSLWAIIKSRTQHQDSRPAWLNAAAAQAFLTKTGDLLHVKLVQVGEDFYLGTAQTLATLAVSGFHQAFYTLAEISTMQTLVTEQRGEQRTDHYLSAERYLTFPADGADWQLHIGGQCWHLGAFQRAMDTDVICSGDGLNVPLQASGQDQYGRYFDLALPDAPDIQQRFRYIEPNTFWMGSPDSEPEREASETMHEVTLSQGCWVADTCVTQAFWEAIMDNNPSHFKGESRPVDSVSWDDAQVFLKALGTKFPMLSLRLPTEAEWECACRAGTTTPFSFGGNITPKQVNYNGDFPYKGGKKGLTREKTVDVKSLPVNSWGLHEMHGNLWEWCQDWHGHYSSELVSDPSGPEKGEQRVLRGGSWIRNGRYCRSAFRGSGAPDFRDSSFGFRFALGQLSSGQEQAGSPAGQVRRGAAPEQKGGQTASTETNGVLGSPVDVIKNPFGNDS